MSASSLESPGSWRKQSLNAIVRGAEQKLGNQPTEVHLGVITAGLTQLIDHAKTKVSARELTATEHHSFVTGFLHLWRKAGEIGAEARAFPSVLTAMTLLHRTIASLGLNYAGLPAQMQHAWLYAAFLLASQVEETPVGFSPRKMWLRFAYGKTQSEQAGFPRA